MKELGVRLRFDGVEVLLDHWELDPGDELPGFMEVAVRECSFVLVICTPSYKSKSDRRIGGVGYEGSVMTAELFAGANRRKFIPLLRDGEWSTAAPSWLLGSLYLDFRGNGRELDDPYLDLLRTLHGTRQAAPPVGSPPFPSHGEENEHQAHPGAATKTRPAAYSFVLKRLLEAKGEGIEIGMALEWLLSTPQRDPSWSHVWNAAIRANPNSVELLSLGRDWLATTPMDDPSWSHVWHGLMDANPNDELVASLGREWLLRQ